MFFADERMLDECRAYVATPCSPFSRVNTTAKAAALSLTAGKPGSSLSQARTGSRLNPANSHHFDPSSLSSTPTVPSLSTDPEGTATPRPSNNHDRSHTTSDSGFATVEEIPSRERIIDLYASLRQGLPLREWCLQHASLLPGIDVRRFITFGKIKGFVYRSHKYAVALRPGMEDYGGDGTAGAAGRASTAAGAAVKRGRAGVAGAAGGTAAGTTAHDVDDPIANARAHEKAWRKAAMSSGWSNPPLPKDGGGITRPATAVTMTAAAQQQQGSDTPKTISSLQGINGDVTPLVDPPGAVSSATGNVPPVASGVAETGLAAAAGVMPGVEVTVAGAAGGTAGLTVNAAGGIEIGDAAMGRYMDGLHCLDEICTDLRMAERDVVRRLKRASGGDVAFVYR